MNSYILTEYGVKANSTELQTAQIQSVLDMCKEKGGTVIIPKGRFYTAALRLWSDTTLYLQRGAELYGSDNCDDYEIFEIPEGMEMRSDMELITQYYGTPWETYRRAIITAYGEKNISIIGETDSVIDGANCYDPKGEENYRGPHAIFFSCCENVLFAGDTLFAGSIGRTDFAGGDFSTMRQSLKRLATLPDDTQVISGHGEETTIGFEKRSNPFMVGL